MPKWKNVIRRVRLHNILFLCFTLISAVPVLFLSVSVQRSALDKEIAAVQEKHLLLARNLTHALDRYVRDVESGFELYISISDLVREAPPCRVVRGAHVWEGRECTLFRINLTELAV